MTRLKPTPVPPPSSEKFENGIVHPALWLWDSWTAEINGAVHLYCLALSRVDAAGNAVLPENRNNHPFHIRHFKSDDGGQSWMDKGVFLEPDESEGGAFSRNVWSGGVLALGTGDWIAGFTGIREAGSDRPFLQSICIVRSGTEDTVDASTVTNLSCPLRDYDAIRAAGYYLPDRDTLGAFDGEEGGPILAWRDPFILGAGEGRLEVFWSAKIAPARSAVAHATVRMTSQGFQIEKLHPPMTLPDDAAFTQAEVPKIYQSSSGACFMMISACDRLNEDQPAEEVTKVLRLYRSSSIRGPWTPAFANYSSVIPGTDYLFGGSFLQADVDAGQFHLISPYSEYKSQRDQLTFAPLKVVSAPMAETELAAAQKNSK